MVVMMDFTVGTMADYIGFVGCVLLLHNALVSNAFLRAPGMSTLPLHSLQISIKLNGRGHSTQPWELDIYPDFTVQYL